MKKFVAAVVCAVFIFFVVNVDTCNAEAFYSTDDQVIPSVAHGYYAHVGDFFFQSNRNVFITIRKCNIIFYDDPKDFYMYVIEIWQRLNDNPFNVKNITIMSEADSVEIPATYSDRKKGLYIVTDKITYQDVGKVNLVIKSIVSTMLIRITTTTGAVYDFYPSDLYITYAKKVADWASR